MLHTQKISSVSCVKADEAEQRGARRRGGDLNGQLVKKGCEGGN